MLLSLKRAGLSALVLSSAGAVYIGSPFVAAWNIREAIRAGDSQYLRERVDWPSVQMSLKPSLERMLLNVPVPEDTGVPERLTLWQRLKTSIAGPVIGRAVTNYISPEGLPRLIALGRRAMPDHTAALEEERHQPLFDRLCAFWARVHRAEFMSPTRLELDIADRKASERHYIGELQLRGLLWTVVSLRIATVRAAGGAMAASAMER